VLDIDGDHGLSHWARVYKKTQILAKHYEIDSPVFELFALLHDSKRENEFEDKDHGKRAAVFAQEQIKNGTINIDKQNQKRLIYACANHTKANKKAKMYHDLVIQICFDADRLDIGRVGIEPHESYFQTEFAKKWLLEGLM